VLESCFSAMWAGCHLHRWDCLSRNASRVSSSLPCFIVIASECSVRVDFLVHTSRILLVSVFCWNYDAPANSSHVTGPTVDHGA
jgi:hypothetical protein